MDIAKDLSREQARLAFLCMLDETCTIRAPGAVRSSGSRSEASRWWPSALAAMCISQPTLVAERDWNMAPALQTSRSS